MDTPHTGEYYFQLPNEYIKARLLKSTVPALLIGSILGLIITRDFGILLISLAVIAPIYLLMYLFISSYKYVHLSKAGIKGVNFYGLSTKIGWEENAKIELNYKWSMRGNEMYGTVIHSEQNKKIFIPTVIFETEAFKAAVRELCPQHPLIL
jgi:hypothetical protein